MPSHRRKQAEESSRHPESKNTAACSGQCTNPPLVWFGLVWYGPGTYDILVYPSCIRAFENGNNNENIPQASLLLVSALWLMVSWFLRSWCAWASVYGTSLGLRPLILFWYFVLWSTRWIHVRSLSLDGVVLCSVVAFVPVPPLMFFILVLSYILCQPVMYVGGFFPFGGFPQQKLTWCKWLSTWQGSSRASWFKPSGEQAVLGRE